MAKRNVEVIDFEKLLSPVGCHDCCDAVWDTYLHCPVCQKTRADTNLLMNGGVLPPEYFWHWWDNDEPKPRGMLQVQCHGCATIFRGERQAQDEWDEVPMFFGRTTDV